MSFFGENALLTMVDTVVANASQPSFPVSLFCANATAAHDAGVDSKPLNLDKRKYKLENKATKRGPNVRSSIKISRAGAIIDKSINCERIHISIQFKTKDTRENILIGQANMDENTL